MDNITQLIIGAVIGAVVAYIIFQLTLKKASTKKIDEMFHIKEKEIMTV